MTIGEHQVDDAMFTYIAKHHDADTYKLLLKDEPNLTFDKSFAVMQIECRQKATNKIPELLKNENFLFPKSISAEQCTHELVAKFHASLFGENDRVLDMTMGLGVDDFYISQRVKSLTTIEIDPIIAETGEYNLSFLSSNVTVVHNDSVEYLRSLDSSVRYDAIFIDPARRDSSGKRLYGLADCHPDVLSLLSIIKRHTSLLYIKASPMIDITQSMRELGRSLSDVWAVSIKNECKELLFKLDFTATNEGVDFHAINHDGTWQRFDCKENNEKKREQNGVEICRDNFLYEPNANIMKLGCFNDLEQIFEIKKIAKNSHLFVSEKLHKDFPGRRFKIIEVIPFKDRQLKILGKRFKQLNITTRNFRLNADALKKRIGVHDGGSTYLFATTMATNEQVLILTEKAM